MDRVNIPGEAPGSATYYMGFAPEEYGTRLYEMEHYGDAVVRNALMDIGKQRTQPYQAISSSTEYEDLVWKSKGRTIYSCLFEVTYKDIDVTVEPDFETKRLTLQIDPAIDQKQRSQLAEFIPKLFRRLAIVALVLLLIITALEMLGFLSDAEESRAWQVGSLLQLISTLFLMVYWVWIAVKKRQLKRQKGHNRKNGRPE